MNIRAGRRSLGSVVGGRFGEGTTKTPRAPRHQEHQEHQGTKSTKEIRGRTAKALRAQSSQRFMRGPLWGWVWIRRGTGNWIVSSLCLCLLQRPTLYL